MKILFDHGTPAPLRHALTGHVASVSHELNWHKLDNGELLDAAEPLFDLLITTDKNIKHQQNLSGRRLGILVLPTTSWPVIQKHLPLVSETVNSMQPGEYRELAFPPKP